MARTAVLGLGRMGTAIARRLLSTGQPVVVWNRTASRMESLVADGAEAASSPADAARDADVVITMLADPPAVESVVTGPDGVAQAMRAGACLVEMSTIGPAAVRALAERLPAGVALVDAPVVGSVPRAVTGELIVLTSGAPEAVKKAEPVLKTLGTVMPCGDLGTAAALKLVLNTAMITAITGLGEALALADNLGVPPKLAFEALAAGPLGGVARRVRDTASQFPIGLAAKDLDLAASSAGATRRPLAQATLDWLCEAATSGEAESDLAKAVEHIRSHQ
jgi:3-hydroxyisobutyrate dehydrogenase-like beta-hydroxyacid dehydrogenase